MPSQDYLDFELNIEALGNNRLRIRAGSVEAVEVDIPGTFADDIKRIFGILDGSQKVSRAERDRIARIFGEKLFGLVFPDQILAAYRASLQFPGEAGLRIKLLLENAGSLADLPWELLRDPRNDYLALSRLTPVLRDPHVSAVNPPVEMSLPLRVLVLIASPADQPRLEAEDEWNALLEATAEARGRGLLELERLDSPQLAALQRKLRVGVNYQVFHFVGYSAIDEQSHSGVLAFEAARNRTAVAVSGEALARELYEEHNVRLVILDAYQDTHQNLKDAIDNLATGIVARGIPAVVAMQVPISDEAKKIFAQEFYGALSEGYPIEAAAAGARTTMSSTLNNLEWATPALYFHARTGYLFPKRRVAPVRASVGGLRERLPVWGPLALLTIIILAVLIGRLIAGFSPSASNVDLDLLSSIPYPLHVPPGQPVTITLHIQNHGSADSGRFVWEWFRSYDDNNPDANKPTITKEITNLGPGGDMYDLSSLVLPGWGSFPTKTWVNRDNNPLERKIDNNSKTRSIETTKDPFVVNFSVKPDGNPLEAAKFNGKLYDSWGMIFAPESQSPACAQAVVKLQNVDETNRLITGLPDGLVGSTPNSNNPCANLPVDILLGKPAGQFPIGGAAVDFKPTVAGQYSLEVFDKQNKKLTTEPLTVVRADQLNAEQLTLSVTGTPDLTDTKLVFRAPENGQVIILRVTFTVAP